MSVSVKVNPLNYFTDITYKNKVHLKSVAGIMLFSNDSGRLYSLVLELNMNPIDLDAAFTKMMSNYVQGISEVKFVLDSRYVDQVSRLLQKSSIPYQGVAYENTLSGFELLVKCSDKKILVADIKEPGKLFNWKPKLKVLVVDDSATIRKILVDCFSSNPDFEIIGEAENGEEAFLKIQEKKPDVMTLDINMPVLDGLGLLKKIKGKKAPTTILISSIVKGEGETVMHCLEEGAFDYIQKPHFKFIDTFKKELFEKINYSEKSRKENLKKKVHIKTWQGLDSFAYDKNKILTIGASTGGTEAIKEVLLRLPREIPPTFIVQHIPPVFSAAFADKLNGLCPFKVVEAEHGMKVEPNTVYIAPGGKHMGVKGKLIVIDEETPAVSSHKPSVDYMYRNLVKNYKAKDIVAVILTGMGSDGAEGMKEIKDQGGYTIAQDEDTSVVYGMPKKAFEYGGTEKVLPLHNIAKEVMDKLL